MKKYSRTINHKLQGILRLVVIAAPAAQVAAALLAGKLLGYPAALLAMVLVPLVLWPLVELTGRLIDRHTDWS